MQKLGLLLVAGAILMCADIVIAADSADTHPVENPANVVLPSPPALIRDHGRCIVQYVKDDSARIGKLKSNTKSQIKLKKATVAADTASTPE